MELSAENIDDLAIVMSDNTPTIETMDGAVFQIKSNFPNLDMNQAHTSDPQGFLYDTQIESVRPDNTSCSLNDILDDICEMSKTMELDQATVNATNSQFPFPTVTDLPMESSVFYHLPDIGIHQGDYSTHSNYSNQADFLQPLEQWSEYLSTLPPALENLQEVPQLAAVQASPPPTPPPLASAIPQQTPNDEAAISVNLNLNEHQLVSSAPAVPLQLYNNFHFNFSSSESSQLLQPGDKNLVSPKKHQRIQKQVPCFGWARVVPRKTFVQPAKVMILRPLRTRKVGSSRQSFDLSAYFDTSAISIPMIKERPRCKNVNRRKQKLQTIPGAENMIFEIDIQSKVDNKECTRETDKSVDTNNNGDHLYPEAEVPELDEIFKRRRRGPTIRHNPLINQTHAPIKQEGARVSAVEDSLNEATIEVIGSNSDVDSDDAPLTVVKSMKCQNCGKLFKTCRSLTIHLKRCNPMPRSPQDNKLTDHDKAGPQKITVSVNCEGNANQKIEAKNQNLVPRPRTRSQTGAIKRKSTGCYNNVATKRRC